jgi:beta-galactosidase
MVEEYDSLARGVSYALQSQVRSTTCSARIWCDAISLGTASTLFTYADGPYSGKPAVTLNKVGRGSVIYAGTFGDPALVDALVDYAVNLAQIEQLKSPSNPDESQIELAERWRGDQRLLFVLNHGQTSASLVLEGGYHDLLANESLADFIPLMPFQVRILTANNSYPDVQSQPNKGA